MNYFQTITQFIDTEDDEYNKKKYNKNACHFFALKTAYEFMKKKDCSKITHEANIYFAINMNKIYQNHDMFFDEVIKFTNLKTSDISATTTEIIKSGDYPIDLIFPIDSNNSYCVIILKNAKYFNVIYYSGRFFVRDCHEPFQYDFSSRNELVDHLNKTYQFNESIVVDGFPIPEFSSIEYINIDKPFEFKNGILENGISKDKQEEKKEVIDNLKKTEFGISIGHIDYDELDSDSINKNVHDKNKEYNNNIGNNYYNLVQVYKANGNKNINIYKFAIKGGKNLDTENDEENLDTENDGEIGGEVILPASGY